MNVVLGEPAAELFAVPQGYELKVDGVRRFELHGLAPAHVEAGADGAAGDVAIEGRRLIVVEEAVR